MYYCTTCVCSLLRKETVMVQCVLTAGRMRIIVFSSLVLVLSCISFLFPSIASAQTIQSRGQITYTVTDAHGQKHTYKVSQGQDLVVPMGNGKQGFIHYSTSI